MFVCLVIVSARSRSTKGTKSQGTLVERYKTFVCVSWKITWLSKNIVGQLCIRIYTYVYLSYQIKSSFAVQVYGVSVYEVTVHEERSTHQGTSVKTLRNVCMCVLKLKKWLNKWVGRQYIRTNTCVFNRLTSNISALGQFVIR